jgi:hypothetical protein
VTGQGPAPRPVTQQSSFKLVSGCGNVVEGSYCGPGIVSRARAADLKDIGGREIEGRLQENKRRKFKRFQFPNYLCFFPMISQVLFELFLLPLFFAKAF